MIADTSVWIDWLRGDESPPANLLQAELDAGHPVYALPVIIQEILQGARSPGHYHALDRELSRLRVDVSLDGLKVARAAAHVYARCRWAAFTPTHQRLPDCGELRPSRLAAAPQRPRLSVYCESGDRAQTDPCIRPMTKDKRRHIPSRGDAGQETATEAEELSEGSLGVYQGAKRCWAVSDQIR